MDDSKSRPKLIPFHGKLRHPHLKLPYRWFPFPRLYFESGAFRKLTPSQRLVYEFLVFKLNAFAKSEDSLSYEQIAAGTSLSVRSVASIVAQLRKLGLVSTRWNGSGPLLFSLKNLTLPDV